MDVSEFKLTEEKVKKLMPIIEEVLSRRHGKYITLFKVSLGGISVTKEQKRINNSNIRFIFTWNLYSLNPKNR